MTPPRLLLCGLLLSLSISAPTPAGVQQGENPRDVEVLEADVDRPRLVVGDEIDALERAIEPPHRFADREPRWRVDRRDFTFAHYQRTQKKTHEVVWDGERAVALIRSGDIVLLARTPDHAETAVNLPTERMHLDNLPGPSLPTHQFVNRKVQTHGSIYEESGDKAVLRDTWTRTRDGKLIYARRQSLTDYNVEARFVFSVDPVYGYRIDAEREVLFRRRPEPGKVTMNGGTFTPGCYTPWAETAVFDRTVYTPTAGGVVGWANNLLTMDRCDADKQAFDWRDGGFIAYLPDREGWSVAFTRRDGTGRVPMSLCNAHNDFHIKFALGEASVGATGDGRWRFAPVHRLMALPPEMTAAVWDRAELIQAKTASLIVTVGEVEDFERQPVPLTEPARGLVWTAKHPEIVEGVAHSGNQSVRFTGRSWPNLPQVSLQPGAAYRLEGWYKLEPWADDQWQAAIAKDKKRRKKLAANGKPLPPPVDWAARKANTGAWITGDFYEWSPHTGPMLEKMKTTTATPDHEGWQHVVLDFTTPDWGPAINIAFVAEGCTAYLDDFAFRRVDDPPADSAE